MKKLFIIVLLSIIIVFAVHAEPYEFDRDANFFQLEECKDFFIKEKDVKTIKLLNGKKIELKDEYVENDDEFKTLVYTIKGCFFKEKYLIYSDFVPDSWVHYVLNLNNGKVTSIDGMTYLSPNRKYFATEYFGDAFSPPRISVYSLNKNKITRIFTQEYPHNCSVQNTKWIDNQNIDFNIECNWPYDIDTKTSRDDTIDNLKLTLKAGKWEITKNGEPSKIKK